MFKYFIFIAAFGGNICNGHDIDDNSAYNCDERITGGNVVQDFIYPVNSIDAVFYRMDHTYVHNLTP